MKKTEAERGIRYLCGVWAKEKCLAQKTDEEPNFWEFYSWVESNYSEYLNFRDRVGVRHTVEEWFDEEFDQTWRN